MNLLYAPIAKAVPLRGASDMEHAPCRFLKRLAMSTQPKCPMQNLPCAPTRLKNQSAYPPAPLTPTLVQNTLKQHMQSPLPQNLGAHGHDHCLREEEFQVPISKTLKSST